MTASGHHKGPWSDRSNGDARGENGSERRTSDTGEAPHDGKGSAPATSVPWSTRLGSWQARVAARRLTRAAREGFERLAPPSAKSTFNGQALRWSLRESTLEVELHRAPCNEIGTTCLAELEQLAQLVRAGAGGARALLFYSSIDRGFSAGADLRELYSGLIAKYQGQGRGPRTQVAVAHEIRGFIDRIHAVFNTLDTAPITTIAAVHGFVFGGGFELALTCDVIVADRSARFAFPELRLGIVPGFGGIPRLRRDVGNAVVRDLLLTGRSLSAKRAHEVGLVSQLVGRTKSLGVARSVAQQAGRFDPRTTALAKEFTKTLPRAELEREKDLFLEMVASPKFEAALRKFVDSDELRPYLA